MSRSRGWCFTLNNYSREEEEILKKGKHINTVKKWIIGKEIGKEKKTKHLQGYFYFNNARTLKQVKLINDRAHWEAAKGSAKQNFDYCSKDGDFEQSGMIEQPKIERNIAAEEEETIWQSEMKELREEYEKELIEEYEMKLKEINEDYDEENEDYENKLIEEYEEYEDNYDEE